MATVYVPTPLRRLTGGLAKVEATGTDIGTLIQAVDAQYPGVADRLLDDDGNVKRFINVFVNDAEIRHLAEPWLGDLEQMMGGKLKTILQFVSLLLMLWPPGWSAHALAWTTGWWLFWPSFVLALTSALGYLSPRR